MHLLNTMRVVGLSACSIFLGVIIVVIYETRIYPKLLIAREEGRNTTGITWNCTQQCHIPSLESEWQFRAFFTVKDYQCKNLKWYGSNYGRKAVCKDEVFKFVPGDCHVLSFGISDDFSFDDDFASHGCKVYSFDPTVDTGDHQRSENLTFFKLGIGNIQGKRKVGMNGKFAYLPVDRYANILQRLGLTNTTISYLKMDVELSELDFFQDIFRNSPHLLQNIQQLGMEVHHGYKGVGLGVATNYVNEMSPTSTFQLFWQYFHELKCHGFKLIYAYKNFAWTETVWGRV